MSPLPDLHVVEAGEGPPIVLLHGLTATHRYVVHGSRALERGGFRTVAYDARGHGASAPAPDGEGYTYPELAADLLGLLDLLGIDRAVLAGASMGAHTALRLALDEPDRVAGLVVITPASHPDFPPGLERWDRLSAGLRSGGVEGFVEAYGLEHVDPAWRATMEKVLRQRLGAHEHQDAVADALQQVPRSQPFAFEELARVHAPTVVVADRDEADPGHPLAVGEAYAAQIPGARLEVEAEGESPLAWRGGSLSKVIAALASEVL
ncbi:alpha/beta fold hydrolase [Conexibacter sp. SYSU D00693]|uniref:alpha/beta fold hydrolase n=1 Tax=Conexibacter sp. SYSU D00693 TaxID=2812560 RepID=UPI00196A4F18|nr:alpha/beta fold hydrolase [Conexibacter sp. SYSU D00693]